MNIKQNGGEKGVAIGQFSEVALLALLLTQNQYLYCRFWKLDILL